MLSRIEHETAYFLSFCIEQYKRAKNITGKEVVALFNQSGVLDYLAEFYDILHTQGAQWLVADIDEYLSVRKNGKVK